MSMTSIATLNRITPKKLADLLLAEAQQEVEAQGSEGKESKIAIVDVRDDGESYDLCFEILPASFLSISSISLNY